MNPRSSPRFFLPSALLSLLVAGNTVALSACGNSDSDNPPITGTNPPGGENAGAGQGGTGQGGAGQAGRVGAGAGGTAASGGQVGEAGHGGSGPAGQAGSAQGGQAGQGQAGSGPAGQAGSAQGGGQAGSGQAGSGPGGSGPGGNGPGGAGGSNPNAPLDGAFVSYCLTSLGNGDPSKSILFATTLTQTGDHVTATLTPLLTAATSLDDTAGNSVTASAQVNQGASVLSFGQVDIPGAANAISGSDIELNPTVLRVQTQSADRACAELDGALVKPFPYPLDDPGDICLILRVGADGKLPPLPQASEFTCQVPTGPSFDPADKDKYRTVPDGAAVPPGPPADAAPDGMGPEIQAFTRIFLGETDRQGQLDSNAWQDYGFDIDGLTSTVANTYHCQPFEGAKKGDVFVSGKGGVDNSYGKNIMPIISGVAAAPSAGSTNDIRSGNYSFLIAAGKLGAQANYTNVNTQFFSVQGPLDGDGKVIAPTKEQLSQGTYTWHAFPELLKPDGSSKQSFPVGYLVGNTLVSGATVGDLTVVQRTTGVNLLLFIHQGRFSVQLSPDHETGTLGNIGGVLDTEEFVASLKKLAGSLSASLCSGSTFDSIAAQIRQASDIMKDGTQDPTQTCNGISIGLGFETTRAILGAPGPMTPPEVSPCP